MTGRELTNGEQNPNPVSRQIALLNEASRALAEANGVEEITHIRDKAEAVRAYAKQIGLGLEMQNQAAELKLRAERKAGALLADMIVCGGSRKSNCHDDNLKLADLQIDGNESSRWQREAAVPEPEFEKYLTETAAARKEVTSVGLRRHAKKLGLTGRSYRGPRARSSANADSLRDDNASPSNGNGHNPTPANGGSHAETVSEAKNHLGRLVQIIAPFCLTGAITLTTAERRYLARLLEDLQRLLDELGE